MAKKKNKKYQKNTQHKKNTAKLRSRNKQVKESKKEIAPFKEEQKATEVIIENDDFFEDGEELLKDLSDGQESKEENLKDYTPLKDILLQKYNLIKDWALANKKISVPVTVALYTVIIILITIIAQNYIANKSLSSEEKRIIEQMSNAEAHSADITLEKEVTYNINEAFSVTYTSYEFTDKVSAVNASELDNSYENTSSANTYMDIVLTYENKGESEFPAKNASIMSVKCAETEYPCFSAIETEEGKSLEFVTDEVILPGKTTRIHYVFDVPKTIKDSVDTIEAKVIIDNIGYIIKVR